MTFPARLVLVCAIIVLMFTAWPVLRSWINSFIIDRENPTRSDHLIVENWIGDVDIFDETRKIAQQMGKTEIGTIIFEDHYANTRKRQMYLMSAWAAGLDTSAFKLIPVPRLEQKTLHIAQAVLDSAHRLGWKELTVATVEMHSARSKKAYLRAAKNYGIIVHVATFPFENVTAENWHTSASGLAMAFSELIKLIYYDLAVF